MAGGGHAHIVALRQLARKGIPSNLRLTLVSPSEYNMYSGALPGAIAGHWPATDIAIQVEALCRAAGVIFLRDSIRTIDPDTQTAYLTSGELLSYNILSLDTGSSVRSLNIPGSQELELPIRPIRAFLDRWSATLETMTQGGKRNPVIIVGAGLAGIEVCLSIHFGLRQILDTPPRVILLDAAENIASASSSALRRRLEKAVRRAGIDCMTGTRIVSCDGCSVELSNGERMDASIVVNCAGAAPLGWIADTGLKTVNGRVEVNASLQSTSHPNVWASGDTSHFAPHPLAPAGVFAVRAGSVIAQNIRQFAHDRTLVRFTPQTDYLKIVSLGSKSAIAEKFGIAIGGRLLWHLKRWIDTSFLRRHAARSGD